MKFIKLEFKLLPKLRLICDVNDGKQIVNQVNVKGIQKMEGNVNFMMENMKI